MHSVSTSELISREVLAPLSPSASLANTLARKLKFVTSTPSQSLHPLSILARILKDPRLSPEKPAGDEDRYFDNSIKRCGHVIREYAEMWDVDASSPGAVSRRVEEIAWVVTVIYGVGGWRKGHPFKADFFACVACLLPINVQSITCHDVECISSRRASSSHPCLPTFPSTQRACSCALILP